MYYKLFYNPVWESCQLPTPEAYERSPYFLASDHLQQASAYTVKTREEGISSSSSSSWWCIDGTDEYTVGHVKRRLFLRWHSIGHWKYGASRAEPTIHGNTLLKQRRGAWGTAGAHSKSWSGSDSCGSPLLPPCAPVGMTGCQWSAITIWQVQLLLLGGKFENATFFSADPFDCDVGIPGIYLSKVVFC